MGGGEVGGLPVLWSEARPGQARGEAGCELTSGCRWGADWTPPCPPGLGAVSRGRNFWAMLGRDGVLARPARGRAKGSTEARCASASSSSACARPRRSPAPRRCAQRPDLPVSSPRGRNEAARPARVRGRGAGTGPGAGQASPPPRPSQRPCSTTSAGLFPQEAALTKTESCRELANQRGAMEVQAPRGTEPSSSRSRRRGLLCKKEQTKKNKTPGAVWGSQPVVADRGAGPGSTRSRHLGHCERHPQLHCSWAGHCSHPARHGGGGDGGRGPEAFPPAACLCLTCAQSNNF